MNMLLSLKMSKTLGAVLFKGANSEFIYLFIRLYYSNVYFYSHIVK